MKVDPAHLNNLRGLLAKLDQDIAVAKSRGLPVQVLMEERRGAELEARFLERRMRAAELDHGAADPTMRSGRRFSNSTVAKYRPLTFPFRNAMRSFWARVMR